MKKLCPHLITSGVSIVDVSTVVWPKNIIEMQLESINEIFQTLKYFRSLNNKSHDRIKESDTVLKKL